MVHHHLYMHDFRRSDDDTDIRRHNGRHGDMGKVKKRSQKPLELGLPQAKHYWRITQAVHDKNPPEIEEINKPWGPWIQVKLTQGDWLRCGQGSAGQTGCRQPAGYNTLHSGTGKCAYHRGNTRLAEMEGFMIMAHACSRRFNISPAEALIRNVERAEGALLWLDDAVGKANRDSDLEPEGTYGELWLMRERMLKLSTHISMAAITAKAMEIMEEKWKLEGQLMQNILDATVQDVVAEIIVGELALGEGVKTRANEILNGRILALESSEERVNI